MRISQLTAMVKPPQTERGRQFINDIIENSPLLQALNNFELNATQDRFRPAPGGQTVAARALNANYTKSDLALAALQNADLAFVGFILNRDVSHARDNDLGLGIDQDRFYQSELAYRAYETALAIEEQLISGSGASNQIKGLDVILDKTTDVPGFSGFKGVIDAKVTGNNFDLSTSANYASFMEQFDKWKLEVAGLDMMVCNQAMAARMTTIARHFHMYSWDKNEFGKTVEKIGNVQIVPVDNTVITSTEPDTAAAATTTSIYLLSNRVGQYSIGSNSGLEFSDVGELEASQQDSVKFEFRAVNKIVTKRAIRRVWNIKL